MDPGRTKTMQESEARIQVRWFGEFKADVLQDEECLGEIVFSSNPDYGWCPFVSDRIRPELEEFLVEARTFMGTPDPDPATIYAYKRIIAMHHEAVELLGDIYEPQRYHEALLDGRLVFNGRRYGGIWQLQLLRF